MHERVDFNLVDKTTNDIISHKAKIADSFGSRLLGLMFKRGIGPEDALVFYRAPSIHTFCMRFPIDLVFLNKKGKVVRIYENLKPCRLTFCPHSFIAIELPAHRTTQKHLKIGDVLELTPVRN